MYAHNRRREQSGNLDTVLKRLADYMERAALAQRSKKRHLILLSCWWRPCLSLRIGNFCSATFTSLYSQLGAKLPTITKVLLNVRCRRKYGLYFLGFIIAVIVGVFIYIKTLPENLTGYINASFAGNRPIVQLNELPAAAGLLRCWLKWVALAGHYDNVHSERRQYHYDLRLTDVKQEMLGWWRFRRTDGQEKVFLRWCANVNVGENR